MGRMMERFFSRAGYPVLIADVRDGPIDWESVAANDAILLSVPISRMESVVRELGPFTREQGVVIDIASLKQEPVRAARKHCKGEVIGCHPLFGPTFDLMKDQVVFLCPGESPRWIGWFRSFLKDLGAVIVEISPEDHDKLMGPVQALRHILMLSFGMSLMRLEYDVEKSLPVSGMWFAQLVSLLSRQLEQSADLYAELGFQNPAAGEVIQAFSSSVDEICSVYMSKDREELQRIMSELSSHFGSVPSPDTR